ncbi:MAG: hypothetical protein EBX52_10585 [Proteobacteria bacterium]|nr:hypothetical protein [Pseudomonadota bacterium]
MGTMKSRGLIFSKLFLLTVLLAPTSAFAQGNSAPDDLPVSRIEAGEGNEKISITVGTFEDNQAETAAERISRMIGQEVEASVTTLDLELGEVVAEDPAFDGVQSARGFLSRVKEKLGAVKREVKREVTLRLSREHLQKLKSKAVGWVANRSPNTWLWIRVGSNTGLATGAFLYLGHYPFTGAMAAGLSVLISSAVTAKLATRLNDFQNFTRIWNDTRAGAAIEKGKLDKDLKSIVVDEAHGLVNYGVIELLFTSALVGLRTGGFILLSKANLLGMPVPSVEVAGFLESFAWTMASQMVWDRGAGSLKNYLKLNGYSDEAADRLRIPYMALGSVVSVSSFTIMQGVDPMIGKIGLGLLGASGLAVTGYFESKVAKIKRGSGGASRCNDLAVRP